MSLSEATLNIDIDPFAVWAFFDARADTNIGRVIVEGKLLFRHCGPLCSQAQADICFLALRV